MSENTKIEWAHHTFNPWWGCTAVSEGCRNCYAETWAKRFGVGWGNSAKRRLSSEKVWAQPAKWNAEAEKKGIRYRVFCASMADVFDEKAPEEWRLRLFTVIMKTPALDWLILTKRPQNAAKYFPNAGPPNIWLGVSVEDQATADARIPLLLQIPAAIRFLSCEPLLGPIRIVPWLDNVAITEGGETFRINDFEPDIHWVIVGGESGPGARSMELNWARDILYQCHVAGVPAFMKQLGSKPLHEGKTWSIVDSKGGDLAAMPIGLVRREFPEVRG